MLFPVTPGGAQFTSQKDLFKQACLSLLIQGFPGVLILVGHFLDAFLLEVNFISWKLNSMAPLLDSLEIPIGFVQQECYRVKFPLI